jgi:hypothetical protein
VDIVLPLLAVDLERYQRLQRPTFERFYADLGTTWIIVRPEDLRVIEEATSSLAGVRILEEGELVPELPTSAWMKRVIPSGWRRQMLIKLAAVAQVVDSPFALVLDADIVAVRPFSDADLLEDGRALRPKEWTGRHVQWIRQASVVLRMDALEWSASLTPSVLSRDAVRLLAQYAAMSVRPSRLRLRIATAIPGLRRRLTGWRGRLLGAFPWTEYHLYDTFLAGTGQFERFHVSPAGKKLYDNCVWHKDSFDLWIPGATTQATYFFSVVQSKKGIPVAAIEEKLRNAGLLTAASDAPVELPELAMPELGEQRNGPG